MKWAERRRLTSPGPFGDPAALERLLGWIEDYGIENAVQRFHDLACGVQGYGRPNEEAERRPYAFAGLVAIWRGTWSADLLPAAMAGRLPPPPSKRLMAQALEAARILAGQVITRDAELRLIWEAGSNSGEAIRESLASLKRALE